MFVDPLLQFLQNHRPILYHIFPTEGSKIIVEGLPGWETLLLGKLWLLQQPDRFLTLRFNSGFPWQTQVREHQEVLLQQQLPSRVPTDKPIPRKGFKLRDRLWGVGRGSDDRVEEEGLLRREVQEDPSEGGR